MEQIYNIYDRICKRCLSLSNQSTINLINGLYQKNYPPDSEVTYNWTEHTAEDLTRTLADTIITINQYDSYHMEIQMYPDGDIVLRVFEYGFHHARTVSDKATLLQFPEPLILYLYESGDAPQFQELVIDFGNQGQFTYRVPTFKYLNFSLEELNQRKLIVLIPFQLLKLRKSIEKKRTPENLEALKTLICCDIIKTIEANEAAGNLTRSEGRKLRRMTLQLYQHIYHGYKEMEESGMNEIAEEALVLDIDIIEYEHKKEIERIQEGYKRELEAQAETFEREYEAQKLETEAQKQEAEVQKLEAEVQKQMAEAQKQEADSQAKIILALKLLLKGEADAVIMEASGLTQQELTRLKDS